MHIGKIEECDLAQLAGLYRQLQEHEPATDTMAAALARSRRDANHLILGAKVGAELVGTVLGVVCPMLFGQCRAFMIVEDVVVHDAHRRTGVGRALMEAIESRARERDCSYIMLITDQDRPDAHRFYGSLGYQTDPYRAFKKSL